MARPIEAFDAYFSASASRIYPVPDYPPDSAYQVTRSNWRAQLDALHAREGTWRAVADRLGVRSTSTVRRWRQLGTGKDITAKVAAARAEDRRRDRAAVTRERAQARARQDKFRGDRAAQVASVDWRRLVMHDVTLIFSPPARTPPQQVNLGPALGRVPALLGRVTGTYVRGDANFFRYALEAAMSHPAYGMPDGVQIEDVGSVSFGQST